MSKVKAVFLDAYTLDPGDNDLSLLSDLLDLEIYPRTLVNEIIERARSCEVVITNKCKLNRVILHALPNLKFIQVAATGYNNIDIAYASENNIKVCNVAGYSTASVTQHVFAMILNYLNQTALYTNESKEGIWSYRPDFSYWHSPIEELKGKTLGLIGFGKIGQSVARVAHAFGMKVMVLKYMDLNSEDYFTVVDFDSLLQNSDIISLHAPLNASTKNIIDRNSLHKMKKQCILVNTGRGGLIDEEDLFHALRDGEIGVALLDVLNTEPPNPEHILLKLDNCFITPHQAWASLQARRQLVRLMSDNIESYLRSDANLKMVY